MALHDNNQARPSSGLGIASLVTGIAALVMCGFGIIVGPIAVALGVLSGRRGGFGGKEIAGIITGALGFLFSAVAVIALVSYIQDNGAEDPQPTAILTGSDDSTGSDEGAETADASAGPVLTEAGVAEAGFATAYAAYLDTYGVSSSFDGMYAGDAIDTPCFSMDGEAWWITQGSAETCEPASELWWETYSDSAEYEIKLFGSGGVGSAISFEALTTDLLMEKFASTEMAAVSAYARDTLLPESGATDIVETQIELGGQPAVQLDCSIGGLVAYRLDVVMLPEPRVLDDGTEIVGFIIHAYNESEWVYASDDVFARLDQTLVWK